MIPAEGCAYCGHPLHGTAVCGMENPPRRRVNPPTGIIADIVTFCECEGIKTPTVQGTSGGRSAPPGQAVAPPPLPPENGDAYLRKLKRRYALMLLGFFMLPAIYYGTATWLGLSLTPLMRDTLFLVILSVEAVIAYFTLRIGYVTDIAQYHVTALVKEFDDIKDDLKRMKDFLQKLKPLLPDLERLLENVDPAMVRNAIREATDHLSARADPNRDALIRAAAAKARERKAPPPPPVEAPAKTEKSP